MNQYVKISPSLFLAKQIVATEPKTSQKASVKTNHIWIYDRSGSMTGVLPDLAKDLIDKAKTIPLGDTLSLAYFSGEKVFNFIIKGFKISENNDYAVLENIINANKRSLGTTCFSEVLHETEKVINDLSVISNTFALCFFSDGCPTCSNHEKELKSIFDAISKISGKITSSLLVGYSNFYNKILMADMAQKLGGALIHSESLSHFNIALSNFIGGVKNTQSKITVELPKNHKKLAVFNVNGDQINIFETEKDNVDIQDNTEEIFFLTENEPDKTFKQIKFTDKNTKGDSDAEGLVRGAFAASYILVQQTKTDKALEVLSVLGDKALIQAANNAFTNTEYGAVEQRIKTAVSNPTVRFASGRDTKYLPAADAFCLLDSMELLMSDPVAKFYPFHPDFKYNRIGSATKVKGDYPHFEADKSCATPIGDLVWNATKLNLSIRSYIPGMVKLMHEPEKVGLQPEWFTHIYRTFTIVKDGFVNIPQLPVSMSKSTFDKLKENGMISPEQIYAENTAYCLDLMAVPVMNRSIVNGKTSATELCKECFKETKLEGIIKVIKYHLAKYEKKIDETLTSEQQALLEKNGITRNGFAPPVEKEEATDFYYAKEFDVKIKGFSSFPKVDDLLAKRNGKAKLTPALSVMEEGYCMIEHDLLAPEPKREEGLNEYLKQAKKALVGIRSNIQRTKFAIIMGKKWFDEFTSRENNSLNIDGQEFTISLREVKVEY